jgi:hypothetical protein
MLIKEMSVFDEMLGDAPLAQGDAVSGRERTLDGLDRGHVRAPAERVCIFELGNCYTPRNKGLKHKLLK